MDTILVLALAVLICCGLKYFTYFPHMLDATSMEYWFFILSAAFSMVGFFILLKVSLRVHYAWDTLSENSCLWIDIFWSAIYMMHVMYILVKQRIREVRYVCRINAMQAKRKQARG